MSLLATDFKSIQPYPHLTSNNGNGFGRIGTPLSGVESSLFSNLLSGQTSRTVAEYSFEVKESPKFEETNSSDLSLDTRTKENSSKVEAKENKELDREPVIEKASKSEKKAEVSETSEKSNGNTEGDSIALLLQKVNQFLKQNPDFMKKIEAAAAEMNVPMNVVKNALANGMNTSSEIKQVIQKAVAALKSSSGMFAKPEVNAFLKEIAPLLNDKNTEKVAAKTDHSLENVGKKEGGNVLSSKVSEGQSNSVAVTKETKEQAATENILKTGDMTKLEAGEKSEKGAKVSEQRTEKETKTISTEATGKNDLNKENTLLQGLRNGREEMSGVQKNSKAEGVLSAVSNESAGTVAKATSGQTSSGNSDFGGSDFSAKNGKGANSESSNSSIDTSSLGKSFKTMYEKTMEMPRMRANANELVTKMAEQIKTGIIEGKEFMSVKLSPGNLGDVKILMSNEDGVYSGKIIVESQEVKELIDTGMRDLKDQLSSQGYDFQNFSVDVASHQESGARNSSQNETVKSELGNSHLKLEREAEEKGATIELSLSDKLVNIVA